MEAIDAIITKADFVGFENRLSETFLLSTF